MGFYKLKTGPSYKLKTGPSFFFAVFPQFYSVFGFFCNTNSVTVCQNNVFAKFWVIKNEVFEKKIAFFVFFFVMLEKRNRKKKKNKKGKIAKNPIKIGFFKVVMQKCEKSKKWIFSKNCLTLFVSGRETKNAHFRCNYLFWPKFFFGPKQCKAENTIKIGVSADIAKKTKMTPFLGKRCFLTWLKKWVLLTVFLKSCVFLKTQFL